MTRRLAAPEQTVVDMGEAAGAEAIANAGLTGADIDAVLVATVTHLYQTPAAAPLVAHRLGATPAAAFDISAACAGFCHGVGLASDMVRGGSARHVLVIGVEKLSDFTDPRDRSTAFIFGDGAGAVVVSASDTPGIGPTMWGSDGAQWDVITQNQSWDQLRERPRAASGPPCAWRARASSAGPSGRWPRWRARRSTPRASRRTTWPRSSPTRPTSASSTRWSSSSGCPSTSPVARDIVEIGNTSAASIPLAMDRMLADGSAPHGGLALLIGFGAGLVYAAQVVELP